MTAPPLQRRPTRNESDWSLAELGRSVTTLTTAVTTLTATLGELGRTVAEHGSRLRTLERLACSTIGAGISLGVGALASGHIHWA
jgi:hypothetical protein